MNTKQSLRQRVKSKLDVLSPAERRERSLLIQEKLFGLDVFNKAAAVCFYVSIASEVDTVSMIERALRQGKKVLAPVVNLKENTLSLRELKDPGGDLKKGAFGIMEPDPQTTRLAGFEEVECVIVPGLVFDRENHRIGRGLGFYDRFLKLLGARVSKIGLAFSFQVVTKIPVEAHDENVDLVLTD